MSTQTKRFCFTLNNYTPEDVLNVNALECKFIVYGYEVAPTTGTPHLQGYIELFDKTTLKGMAKRLPRTSYKICHGTAQQNIDYCKKEGKDIYTKGTPYEQGKRTDLDSIKDEILSGATTVDAITLDRPAMFHMYGRTLTKIEDLRMRKLFRTEMTTCTWYYGPSGAGKSHKAYEGFTPDTHYNWKDDNGWNDGYAQQDTVIINEFRGHIKFEALLKMVDRWPFEVNRRGREPMPFTSKNIIITSRVPPSEVYQIEDKTEFYRRIKVVRLEPRNNNIGVVHGIREASSQGSEESSETQVRFEQEI